ncbi:hypothetical protein Tco_0513391 [Tanacetum coccineum]
MTKVIKEEFEKLGSSDTSLEIFHNEFNRMNRMDEDLFTYEVEIPELTNIPCDLNKDDDLEQPMTHGSNDDMEYDPSDVEFIEWLASKFYNYKTMNQFTKRVLWDYWTSGNDEVELTDEETSDSDDENEVAEIFRIETNGFKTYDEYKDDWIYEWNNDVPWVHEKPRTENEVWEEPVPVKHCCKPFNYKNRCSEWPTCSWKNDRYCNGGNLPGAYIVGNSLRYQDLERYKALKDGELKDEALRNKAIIEGIIDDDDESSNEERHELCDDDNQERSVCNIRRFVMIKYSFKDDDLEQPMTHGSNDDMEYDPSDVEFIEWLASKFYNYKTMNQFTKRALWDYWTSGNDEVELTDEETSDSDDENEVAEIFRIETNVFDFETPTCKDFKEFNYLLQIDPDVLTNDIEGFKTYDEYKDDWIYEWNNDVPWVHEKPWTENEVWEEPVPVKHCCKPFNYKNRCSEWPTCSWKNDGYCNGGNLPGAYIVGNSLRYQDLERYKALKDGELKDEALRNKAIMEGIIDDDDESSNEERHELCDDDNQERPVCNIRRFVMIKYSFRDDEKYVAIKEDEYEDLTSTSEEACRAYQEIFRMMDEGWMVNKDECFSGDNPDYYLFLSSLSSQTSIRRPRCKEIDNVGGVSVI